VAGNCRNLQDACSKQDLVSVTCGILQELASTFFSKKNLQVSSRSLNSHMLDPTLTSVLQVPAISCHLQSILARMDSWDIFKILKSCESLSVIFQLRNLCRAPELDPDLHYLLRKHINLVYTISFSMLNAIKKGAKTGTIIDTTYFICRSF
jgi:hypothetical protein